MLAHKGTQTIVTKRLKLRKFLISDAEQMYKNYASDSEVIGSISTISIDQKNCSCEIGYCLSRKYWQKGITTEAVQAVMSFLFNEVNIHRIVAKHDVENPASGMVMKKCNMIYEGTLRKHYLRHDNTYSDSILYSILKEEFII